MATVDTGCGFLWGAVVTVYQTHDELSFLDGTIYLKRISVIIAQFLCCPIITIGGSYPGWLSAMMRLRYPAVVDIAYSASAPMYFYTQEVDQFDYYELITQSAEKSVKDCSSSVREAINAVHALNTVDKVIQELDICTPLPEYLRGDGPENTKLFFEEFFCPIFGMFF